MSSATLINTKLVFRTYAVLAAVLGMITDDGGGFIPDKVLSGMGRRNMEAGAQEVGGTCVIRYVHTMTVCTIPGCGFQHPAQPQK